MIAREAGMSPEPDGKAPRSPRRRVLLTGQYQSLAGTFSVDVRNLSNTGASIMCAADLKLGSEGVLMAGGLDCLCRVVWHRGDVFGLRFEEPLHNSIVLDLHRVTSEEVRYAERIATHVWYHRDAR
jgi:hypothetical protein